MYKTTYLHTINPPSKPILLYHSYDTITITINIGHSLSHYHRHHHPPTPPIITTRLPSSTTTVASTSRAALPPTSEHDSSFMYNTHQPSASVSPVEQSLLHKLPAVRPHIIHEGSFCAHRHRPSAPIGHRHCHCPLFNAR